MKRSRGRSKPRLTRDAEKLISLALGFAASTSRTEDHYWDSALEATLTTLLNTHHDAAIEGALEHLFASHGAAYEELLDSVESLAESVEIEAEGKVWQAMVIGAPVIAASKYSIPSGPIDAENAEQLGELLRTQVLASNARLAFAANLFSIEHLPKKFSAMRELATELAEAAIAGTAPTINLKNLPETPHMLADVRFLVAVVVAERGLPHFRWQEIGGRIHAGRAQCLEQWISHATPVLTTLLPGCQIECVLPDAYFSSAREADRRVRPVSLRAAVAFLSATLNCPPTELRALIAGFGEAQVDELRISFTHKDDQEVVHGILWPLFGDEDVASTPGPIEDVELCLRASGVTKIDRLSERFAPEFCSDCGAPLFADPAGDVVHPELPEDIEVPHSYLH